LAERRDQTHTGLAEAVLKMFARLKTFRGDRERTIGLVDNSEIALVVGDAAVKFGSLHR